MEYTYKYDIGEIIKDDKRDITIIGREVRVKKTSKRNYYDRWYKYHCNKCGNEDWLEQDKLRNRKQGCNVCCLGSNKVTEGINDIPTVAPWMVKYFQGGSNEAKNYSIGSNKKINPICPICGEIRKNPISINNM